MEKQLLGISARQIERKAARENGFGLLEFKVPSILWRRTTVPRLSRSELQFWSVLGVAERWLGRRRGNAWEADLCETMKAG
jgi:hypothetical protein